MTRRDLSARNSANRVVSMLLLTLSNVVTIGQQFLFCGLKTAFCLTFRSGIAQYSCVVGRTTEM
jgi:hypothetical protein